MPDVRPIVEQIGLDVRDQRIDPQLLNNDHLHYQRPLGEARVQGLLERFEKRPELAQKPIVAALREDGTFWVLDGQHHSEAAKRMGVPTVPAMVFNSSGWQEEARVFSQFQKIQQIDKFDDVTRKADKQVADPASLAALVKDYRAEHGNYVSRENARMQFADYADTPETRSRYGAAVDNAADAVAKETYKQLLAEPSPSGSNHVLIAGGGAASGKESALRDIPGADVAGNRAGLQSNVDAIYDTSLANGKSARKRIDDALAAGKTVDLVYVHRPLDLAAEGLVDRAARTGRTMSLDALVTDHMKAQKTALELADHYKDDPRVQFALLDNSRGPHEARERDFGDLRKLQYPSRDAALELASEGAERAYLRRAERGEPLPEQLTAAIVGSQKAKELKLEAATSEVVRRDARLELEARGHAPGAIEEVNLERGASLTGRVLAVGKDDVAVSAGRGGFAVAKVDRGHRPEVGDVVRLDVGKHVSISRDVERAKELAR